MSRNEFGTLIKEWATPVSVITMGIGLFISFNTRVAMDNDAVNRLGKRIDEIENRFVRKMEQTDAKTEQLLVNTSVIQSQLNYIKQK